MGLATSKPMYLIPEFFRTKPTEVLIGKGILPDDLNDDSLGRVLDVLAENDVSKIFSHVALNAVKTYNIATDHLHGDTTNMQVYGDYEKNGDLIAFGYPKHGRPDLKQFMLSLITTFDGAVPLFMKTLRGNTSDTTHFRDLITLIEKNVKDREEESYFTLDSAAYCEENLKILNKVLIITRVPERISAVKEIKESYAHALDQFDGNDNYKFAETCSIYGGVKQRWIIVYSRLAHEREDQAIKALVQKEKIILEQALKKLERRQFSCQLDAKNIVGDIARQYKFHDIDIVDIVVENRFLSAGKPSKETPKESYFMLKLALKERTNHIEKQIKLGSMFVLATTQLDYEKLPTKAVLGEYKGQSPLENRFNLLKNATCISSKVYLKNENRITALAMIMCLSLLVYALAERQLRKSLVALNKTVPHQSKKQIQNPTMKWIFKMFEGVGLVTVDLGSQITQEVTNLSSTLKDILGHLGPECMDIYQIVPKGCGM